MLAIRGSLITRSKISNNSTKRKRGNSCPYMIATVRQKIFNMLPKPGCCCFCCYWSVPLVAAAHAAAAGPGGGGEGFITTEGIEVYRQIGSPLSLFWPAGTYLGSGLFSRQASVAIRMVTRSSKASSSSSSNRCDRASDAPNEGPLSKLLCDRFRAAVYCRRLRSAGKPPPADSTSTDSRSSSSSTELPDVWRAVDGEADGLPGVEVDVYGSVGYLSFLLLLFAAAAVCCCYCLLLLLFGAIAA